MPGFALQLLAARFSAAGYATHLFRYRGRSPLEANVEGLARFVGAAIGERAAHFVGHSLGGLLILETVNRHAQMAVASAVLLGSPVRGCLSGRRLRATAAGRWMMGACAPLWDEREARWVRDAPLGVIAGTLSMGLGRLLGRLPDANDGVVRVCETAVEGMTACRHVEHAHSSLIVSRQVADLTAGFMARGQFE
jgi:pimeloyl-ACP methyl ester carboxylesterase